MHYIRGPILIASLRVYKLTGPGLPMWIEVNTTTSKQGLIWVRVRTDGLSLLELERRTCKTMPPSSIFL